MRMQKDTDIPYTVFYWPDSAPLTLLTSKKWHCVRSWVLCPALKRARTFKNSFLAQLNNLPFFITFSSHSLSHLFLC